MIITWFQEFCIETVAFRIFLAVLLGGLLGFERQRKNSPAGLRTNILVCLGACMVILSYTGQRDGEGNPYHAEGAGIQSECIDSQPS